MPLRNPGVTTVAITNVEDGTASAEIDELSIEEPMEIELSFPSDGGMCRKSIAVTMRTPGHDIELAAGFLFTEGMIQTRNDLASIEETSTNVIHATIHSSAPIDISKLDRQSFVSSSCGVCGKRSIAAVFATKHYHTQYGIPQIESDIINGLPRTQRAAQDNFRRTGGIHATALFDETGNLLSLYEDVGRHNALDKLIGAELLADRLPLTNRLVLVSGRASFELIQKASIAGIPVVAAVGAPSSLAVSLAREASMTLLGFVRDGRFNVYADAGRLRKGKVNLHEFCR